MPTFIETCNCKGTRPLGVIGRRYTSRPDITGALLKDRHVARFVVAPTGFGKSNVVYEYASIIFAFKHVFWIKCDSPCFLRDLDAGALYSGIIECDPDVELVICEDLPFMDFDRSALMNTFINALLDRDCEVIVTCTPSSDAFSNLQRDRIVIRPKDLMLTDNELTIEELRGTVGENWRDQIKPNERIACNIWGDNGKSILLAGLKTENFPQEIKLSILILLIGQAGMIDSLSHFLPKDHIDEIISILESDYPMLGVESRTKTYSSLDVSIQEIASGFCARIDDAVIASVYEDRDKLCCAIADWLCESSAVTRACEVMEIYATKYGSARWLSQKGWKLLASLNPFPCIKLHDVSRRGAVGYYDSLSSVKAWGSYLLADNNCAIKYARRLLRSSGARVEERICASILLVFLDDRNSIKEAFALLKEAASTEVKGIEAQRVYDIVDWRCLAKLVTGDAPFAFKWLKDAYSKLHVSYDRTSFDDELLRNTFLMCAAWMMRINSSNENVVSKSDLGASDLGTSDLGATDEANAANTEKMESMADKVSSTSISSATNATDSIDTTNTVAHGDLFLIAKLVLNLIASNLQSDLQSFDLFDMLAVEAIRDLDDSTSGSHELKTDLIDSNIDSLFQQVQINIYRQREEYKKYLVNEIESKLEFQRTNPDIFRKNEVKETNVVSKYATPPLYVALFGGLQVKIGDDVVDSKLLSRKKSKLLLAILVINKGREVSKAQILKTLWPNGDVDTYKRNFYSVWSQLKKALSLNGSCPYLIRTQSGCRLDKRYLRSDLDKFDELCKALLFGSDAQVSWEILYSQVNEEFAEDLLPSLIDNDQINLLREKYRESLIDGLIAASSRLNGLGEPRGALWFAREAIRRNDKREDAYIALMEAQIFANQRGAALETYFSCRKFLSEELGIDPSLKVIELYKSIIECEEELD